MRVGLTHARTRPLQVADAIATPVVGYCSDRTRSAWGSRQPWHLAGSVGVALAFPVLLSACWPAQRLEASSARWVHSPALLRAVELLYYAVVRAAHGCARRDEH